MTGFKTRIYGLGGEGLTLRLYLARMFSKNHMTDSLSFAHGHLNKQFSSLKISDTAKKIGSDAS